jgi:DNA ligase (NAD+)
MGSQEKASDPEAFLEWAVKVGHPTWLVQHKLDGASLELQYEDGRFVRAVTRGDGETGDDITPNALRMGGLVRVLPGAFSGGVRGEVLMPRAVHQAKYADKANCRNAANGLMKRKDGAGSDDLRVVVYDVLSLEDVARVAASANPAARMASRAAATATPSLFDEPGPSTGTAARSPEAAGSGALPAFDDEVAKLEWLARAGFEVVPWVLEPSPEAVVAFRGKVMDERPSLPYDIDGLVVRGRAVDWADLRRARPEKQIAFKFSLEEAVTTLRAVEWSESGATYTPVGIVDPVRLAGTTVQRASLANPGIMRALGLRLGSRVVITKRGEIIPKIESLVENPEGAAEIEVPTRCSCGAALVDEGTRLACPNPDCPKKVLHRLEKWLSVLDIRDFGTTILARLFESGRVRSIPALYTLESGELAEYERMGETLAAKIVRNLRARNEVPLATFVAGLDIEGIGELLAEKAVGAGFDTLERLRAASVEELSAVDGFGEITARALSEGLGRLGAEIDGLLASGALGIRPPASGGPLSGKSFCFTGELASMKRKDAEALAKSLGAAIRSGVTKDLSYLVTNDPGSGSAKNRKALELGVAVIDEAAFLALAGAT